MTDHRFKIGQMVFFHPRWRRVDAHRKTPYQITARLPPTEGELQYRIRSAFEGDERAASERELRPAQAYT